MDIKIDKNSVIVLDLDDTLYNELDYLKSAYQSIAKHFEPENWRLLYAEILSMYRSKQNVFELLSKRYNTKLALILKMYREHHPNITLSDGAFIFLNGVKRNGGKLAIITDGRALTQNAKIKSLGISKMIDQIVISEILGTEKPCLDNFRAVEKLFPNKSYCYIADNLKKDFIAPNKLGWETIALIDNGKNIHHDTYSYLDKKFRPNNFILSFKDLKVSE